MDGSLGAQASPGLGQDETRLAAFLRGARETPLVPSLILALAFVGFGALTSQTGLSLLDTVFISAFMFALPGQVVLVDEMARGTSVLTAAIAVTATGVRLLPMTAVVLPMIRDRNAPKWLELAVSYHVAVTVWVETMRRAPHVPRPLRSAYCLGINLWLVGVSTLGGVAGFLLATEVPPPVAAALLFMTPLYFLLGMLMTATTSASLAPILFGLVLGPVFYVWAPGFDLVLTGLIGGTAAYVFGLRRRNDRDGA